MDRNLLTHSRENVSTAGCDSYDIDSITIAEILSRMESRMDNLMLRRECEIQSLEQGVDELRSGVNNIKPSLQELTNDTQESQEYRGREYAGGVISIRNQLAYMFLNSTQNAQRKQLIADPIDIRVSVYDGNEFTYDVNLLTTINIADLHPAYFDICVDTVFGAPKNLIKRLLKWDKTREYQVYRIFDDHENAWHDGFASTCPKPFKKWLSSIICLETYESAISDNRSPDLEIHTGSKGASQESTSRMERNLYGCQVQLRKETS